MDKRKAQARLARRYEKIKGKVPTFSGIRIDEFDAEDVFKLVYVFADAYFKEQEKHFSALRRMSNGRRGLR